jgi:chromosome segregation ATPase
MSQREGLSDRDELVLEALERPEQDDDDLAGRIAALESLVESLQADIAQLEADLTAEREHKRELVQAVNRLQDAVEGRDEMVGASTLEKYASMDEADREALLSTSERRAVSIYRHWDELAWVANGKELLETQARANAKNNPSKLRYRLKKHFDQSLQANEMYRALKAVARLSGGDEETDTNGRTHITGGAFEYHVLPTVDGTKTRRVLERVSDR